MKHSSLRRRCCFSSYCWLTTLLLASSVVHVSPETSSTMANPQASSELPRGYRESTSAYSVAADMLRMMMDLSAATIVNTTSIGQPYSVTTTTTTTTTTATATTAATAPTTRASQLQLQQQQQRTSSLASGTLLEQNLMPTSQPFPPSPQRGRRLVRQVELEPVDKCRLFVEGEPGKNELYSPDYPNDYPKNINCTRIITAPKGQIIRLDFRNSFHVEAKEECKFDFLEIRDGQYGFSNLIGKYCGTDFPPEITSKERYLWLHFHSDESIEYSGFTAVYEFIDRNREAPSTDLNCTIEKDGFEGFINSTDVPADIKDTVIKNKIPLDCMWRIQVQEKWKIQVKFLDFKLSKPNDCESNFLDIFPEQTVMPLRVKNFCGSAGEGITSETNILHMRFYAEQTAITSTFAILYTAFRDRGSGACNEDEYDCEDATCISEKLHCNERDNCKFRWDEEGCKPESGGQSEHVVIIIIVFGLILGGMVVTFLVNCVRKIMRDQKIIREHIRQSKESKLDEMGRSSKARSREPTAIAMSPRQKHSQTSLQILDDVSNRYYRDVVPISVQASKADLGDKEHSILRHHHDMVVQTSLCSGGNGGGDDSSSTTNEAYVGGTGGAGACDMGCQTRESLFATSLLRQKSISSMGRAGGETGPGPTLPPPRFSTFGYEPAASTTLSRHGIHVAPGSIEVLDEQHNPALEYAMQHPRNRPQEMCHHHHQHQQHLQQQHKPDANQTLPLHQRHHQQQHVHQQHMPHSHHHQQQQQQQQSQAQPQHVQSKSIVVLPSPFSVTTKSSAAAPPAGGKNKQQKVDESKVFIDIRNSAPDVIIMTSH